MPHFRTSTPAVTILFLYSVFIIKQNYNEKSVISVLVPLILSIPKFLKIYSKFTTSRSLKYSYLQYGTAIKVN